jgi:hypothetical protein
MIAGIVFVVLLGAVFLPRMFVDQTPVAIVGLRLDSGPARIQVTNVTVSLELTKFRANFSENETVVASLPPGLASASGSIHFVDANGDGLLDAGDHFDIACNPAASYRFEIFQVDVDRRVGYLSWAGCP